MIDFDIETEPLPESELVAMMPEFTAPSNYKDAEKIAQNIAEQKAKWIERAALDPMTGRVLAIGWRDHTCFASVSGDTEHDLLSNFAATLQTLSLIAGQPMVYGWNIRGFDIPFLVKRGWKHGIHFPKWLTDRAPYGMEPPVVDLMQVWQAGDYKAGYTSLDTAARHLGIPGKLGKGEDFAKLYHSDRQAALEYLKRDVELISQIRGMICH